MNENIDRLRHGWYPRKNASWVWWVLADMIALWSITRSVIRRATRGTPQ